MWKWIRKSKFSSIRDFIFCVSAFGLPSGCRKPDGSHKRDCFQSFPILNLKTRNWMIEWLIEHQLRRNLCIPAEEIDESIENNLLTYLLFIWAAVYIRTSLPFKWVLPFSLNSFVYSFYKKKKKNFFSFIRPILLLLKEWTNGFCSELWRWHCIVVALDDLFLCYMLRDWQTFISYSYVWIIGQFNCLLSK